MNMKDIFKVALILPVFFMGMAISAEPASVKAQAATKKHSSFVGSNARSMPQAPQKMSIQPSMGGDMAALRARIIRGEKLVERTLPTIKTPEAFIPPSARNPSNLVPGQ